MKSNRGKGWENIFEAFIIILELIILIVMKFLSVCWGKVLLLPFAGILLDPLEY